MGGMVALGSLSNSLITIGFFIEYRHTTYGVKNDSLKKNKKIRIK